MTKTTNYQLNQWAKSDRVLMEDFNSDNQKIDAALGALQFVTGQYTGDGATIQQITLGFRPRMVLVFPNMQNQETRFSQISLALDGLPHNDVTINDAGFTVAGNCNCTTGTSSHNLWCNPYRYVAWH